MISDSPYEMNEQILTPAGGVFAGIVASLLMLVVLSVLHPFSRLSPHALLLRIGQTVVRSGGPAGDGSLLFAATVLHMAIGGVLGLLYAVSQHRIATRGLIAVGVFYGFVIWVVSSILAPVLFGAPLRPVLRSYPWFLGCVLYGLVLSGCAVWGESRRPSAPEHVVPVD